MDTHSLRAVSWIASRMCILSTTPHRRLSKSYTSREQNTDMCSSRTPDILSCILRIQVSLRATRAGIFLATSLSTSPVASPGTLLIKAPCACPPRLFFRLSLTPSSKRNFHLRLAMPCHDDAVQWGYSVPSSPRVGAARESFHDRRKSRKVLVVTHASPVVSNTRTWS